jgi:hypothetical protein
LILHALAAELIDHDCAAAAATPDCRTLLGPGKRGEQRLTNASSARIRQRAPER